MLMDELRRAHLTMPAWNNTPPAVVLEKAWDRGSALARETIARAGMEENRPEMEFSFAKYGPAVKEGQTLRA